MIKRIVVVSLLCTALAPAQTTKKSDSRAAVRVDEALARSTAAGVPGAMNQIDSEKIRAHVKFLASDLLEGRGTGQRGGDIAAEYIATQFALYGLKPAGDNGTYMQKVPMVGITPDPQTVFSFIS